MKKINFVSPFYPYRGGIAQFSDALSIHLQKNNIVSKINFKRLYPSFLFPGKSQYVDSDFDRKLISSGLDSLNPFTIKSIVSKINDVSGAKNILLSVYWMSFFAPILILLNFFVSKKNKKIAIIHNLIPHEQRFFDSFLTRLYLKSQDAYVVLSEKVEKDVLKFQPDAKILRLFHPLYDHFGEKLDKQSARLKLSIAKDRKVILFFGLIRDYKGLDILLQSFSFLDESYLLVIAGECYGSFEKYQLIIDQNNLSNQILHFDKFVSDADVPFLFSSADVCVLPYKKATQSGVTATALHFEVPIVSSNVGGLSEYIKNGENGVLIEPNEPVMLSEAIKTACESTKNQFMIEKTKEIKVLFSWERFSRELNFFIDTLY